MINISFCFWIKRLCEIRFICFKKSNLIITTIFYIENSKFKKGKIFHYKFFLLLNPMHVFHHIHKYNQLQLEIIIIIIIFKIKTFENKKENLQIVNWIFLVWHKSAKFKVPMTFTLKMQESIIFRKQRIILNCFFFINKPHSFDFVWFTPINIWSTSLIKNNYIQK